MGTEEESHRHHPRIRRERPTGLIICPSAIQKGPIFLDFPSYPSSVLVGISRHLFYSSVTIDLNLLTPPPHGHGGVSYCVVHSNTKPSTAFYVISN